MSDFSGLPNPTLQRFLSQFMGMPRVWRKIDPFKNAEYGSDGFGVPNYLLRVFRVLEYVVNPDLIFGGETFQNFPGNREKMYPHTLVPHSGPFGVRARINHATISEIDAPQQH